MGTVVGTKKGGGVTRGPWREAEGAPRGLVALTVEGAGFLKRQGSHG